VDDGWFAFVHDRHTNYIKIHKKQTGRNLNTKDIGMKQTVKATAKHAERDLLFLFIADFIKTSS